MKKIAFVLILLSLLVGSVELLCWFGFRKSTAALGIVDPARFKLSAKHLPDAMRQFDAELGWTGEPDGRKTPVQFGRTVMSCFGDSFTWGDEVRDRETWASVLAESLQANVLNFGVNGYGTDQALMRCRAIALRHPTPVVALGLVSADMPRCLSVYRRFYFPRTSFLVTKPRFVLNAAGELELQPNPIQRREDVARLMDASYIKELGAMDRWYRPAGAPVYEFPFSRLLFHRDVWKAVARARAGVVPDEINAAPANTDIWRDPEACRLFFTIVDSFEREVLARGATPLLVLFPTKQEMTDAAAHGPPLAIRMIEDYCRSRNYEIVDGFISLSGAMREGVPVASLYRKVHLSPEGNRLIADAVLQQLRAHHNALLVDPAG